MITLYDKTLSGDNANKPDCAFCEHVLVVELIRKNLKSLMRRYIVDTLFLISTRLKPDMQLGQK